METNELALVVIFAVAIAVLVEIVKHVDKQSILTAKQIDLLTLALGIAMGLGAMYATGIELSNAVTIGLGGAFISTRVYESAKNWFGNFLGFESEENE